jgi:uncharacterized damage-inducible protein DinB
MAALVLGFGVTACGGAPQAPASATQNPVSDALRSSWNGVKRDIKESADQMAEENFAFKPTPEVRSFGDLLTHVAGASYEFCASAKNEPAPFQEKSFEGKMTTKADIVKVTNDAIAYCDAAFTQVTDANMGEAVHGAFGSKDQTTRAAMLVGQIGHDNEHYGNLVTYFRLKNMVPPSSKRSGA